MPHKTSGQRLDAAPQRACAASQSVLYHGGEITEHHLRRQPIAQPPNLLWLAEPPCQMTNRLQSMVVLAGGPDERGTSSRVRFGFRSTGACVDKVETCGSVDVWTFAGCFWAGPRGLPLRLRGQFLGA